jgi:transposase
MMDVIYERCCGIDVHKNRLTACLFVGRNKEIKEFGIMTDDILKMIKWLKANECQVVAMEATGSYWKPVYHLLEAEEIETLIVNAQHIREYPGEKQTSRIRNGSPIQDMV